ncbi:hypothetical protein LWI29_022368 [Acer saccharum]|uniref:Disease resistance protein At4g27190-like leucine-rich repeats domain-containing protein n=1 Tax=Acer saccharum TaxID=4024 RepID=A0AA39SX81_ACESA|nr:hypothetical protein LWI29_022368 [Acer saccharum]
MSMAASVGMENKEGLKLLVIGGPRAQKMVGIWLFGSAAWVFSMVVLGGVTRLTRSGLSMTDWKFTGGLPPLSDEEWFQEFENVNKGMSIEDFKFIYWMEYAHRMWGRGLGIILPLPFSYFLHKGYITLRLGLRLSSLFALGAGQGFIGWWMVKSGLEEPPSEYAQPRVSPYRLAAHLTSAFVIYSGLFWTGLSAVMPEPPAESVAWVRGAAKVKKLAIPVSFIVGITAISGAFVAGNDAGRAYNTFPKMGDTWIPDDIFDMKPLIRNFFENTSTVQLDHNVLATTTLFSIGALWFSTRKLDIHPAIRSLIGSTVGMAALQGENVFMVKAGMRLKEWPKHQGLEQCTAISLMGNKIEMLPDGLDFVLPTKLLRYCVTVNYAYEEESYPKSRILKISGIEATSLVAFKALCEKSGVEYIELMEIKGCCQNMVPSIDETGLNELKRLSLRSLDELECIIDTTQQQDVAFSNLVDLSIERVGLREICSGGRPPRGFLENLETLDIRRCHSMSSLFPSWVLIQRLRKLKKVTVWWCGELEDVFQLEGLSYAKENPFLLSSLESLDLVCLENLRYIWKGPTQQVSLQSLTVVNVYECNKLRYLFTLSLARSLLQLEQLRVSYCRSFEHIVEIKEAEENVDGGGGNDVMFPELRKLQLVVLKNFINFYSENSPVNMQTAKEKLRVLDVGIISDQLCNSVLAQLIHGFQNLEELTIRECRVQVLSQLELSLPSLKVLKLEYLKQLECLCKGPTHLLSLPNLKKLEVWSCNRLRHMFSPSLARNLLQLEKQSISSCGELEQIFNEDDAAEYNQTLSKDHLQWPLLFPNLSSIDINWCDKLKSMFPVSITHLLSLQNLRTLTLWYCNGLTHLFSTNLARNLLQLESIHVWNCGELEQIIVEDHTEDDHVLLLPQLHKLTLRQLTSLINFCPVGYHFIFPSLSSLEVTECPKLTTRFSVDQNRFVHAEAKAPQTGKEDADMEQSPPETTREIYCWKWEPDSLQKRLPPYIGK